MRMLIKARLPVEPFNASVRDGTALAKLGRLLEDLKPEAAYFTEDNGQRAAYLVVDVAEPSRIPSIADPWFLTFNASVEFQIVMSQEDLGKSGLEQLGKKYAR